MLQLNYIYTEDQQKETQNEAELVFQKKKKRSRTLFIYFWEETSRPVSILLFKNNGITPTPRRKVSYWPVKSHGRSLTT